MLETALPDLKACSAWSEVNACHVALVSVSPMSVAEPQRLARLNTMSAGTDTSTIVVGADTGGRDRFYTDYVSSLPLESLPVDAVCFAAHATDFGAADAGSGRGSPSAFWGPMIAMEAMQEEAELMAGRRSLEAFLEAHPELGFKRQFYFVSMC